MRLSDRIIARRRRFTRALLGEDGNFLLPITTVKQGRWPYLGK